MSSDAEIGYGTLFKIRTSTGPDVFLVIGEQTSIKPYNISVDTIDVTHEESPDAAREFKPGLVDYGEGTIEINYVPGGAAEAALMSRLRTVIVCRTTYPNGAHADFSAILTALEPDSPLDDKMSASFGYKITGTVEVSAAAAPTNSVKPAIAGTAQVGVELTAWEGVWANEPTSFTYVWKNEGVAIGGATARTYTPVVGDIGDNLTVTVTGTNSAGSASATSAETLPAIAA